MRTLCERLRAIDDCPGTVPSEAADYIESLQKKVERLEVEIKAHFTEGEKALQAEVERLMGENNRQREMWHDQRERADRAESEVERLRTENECQRLNLERAVTFRSQPR